VPVMRLRKGELSHRLPTFLPDGRRFLYLNLYSAPERGFLLETWVGSLDDVRPRLLLRSTSVATVVPNGDHVLFARDQTVLAQRLDPGSARLLGEPQPIGEMAIISFVVVGGPVVSGASTGLLAFVSEPRGPSRLQWYDHAGVPGSAIPL